MQRKVINTALSKNGIFSRYFSFATRVFDVDLVPELSKKPKIIIPVNMTRYDGDRKKFDATLSALFKYTATKLEQNEIESVDVIATAALHKDWPESKIAEIDSHFINTHIKLLEKQTGFFLWKNWIEKIGKERHQKYYEEILALSKSGSEWHQLMTNTHAQTSSSKDLDSSLHYQRQEYAAIRCMEAYTDLVYMGRISPAWPFLCQVCPSLPRFVKASFSAQASQIKKYDAEHTVEMLTIMLEHTISSPRFPPKEKKKLIENCFNLFRTYEPSLSMARCADKEASQLIPTKCELL